MISFIFVPGLAPTLVDDRELAWGLIGDGFGTVLMYKILISAKLLETE